MKYDSTKEALIFKLLRPKKYTESSTSCSERCCVCQVKNTKRENMYSIAFVFNCIHPCCRRNIKRTKRWLC